MEMTDIKELNLAAIDVGSNAARLLIKTVSIDLDGRLSQRKALFLRVPLRLGMEVFKKGKISREKEEAFLRTMKAYRQLMKVFKVRDYRACATSAMRDAKNGRQVMDRVNEATGLGLKIISGDEESQIIYDIHLSQLQDDNNYLYVDVGGGSTEVTFISQGQRVMSHSYNIGTVRMLSEAVKAEELQHVRNELGKVAAGYGDITIIGSGGNINKLYKLSKNKLPERSVAMDEVKDIYNRLKALSVEERIEQFGLKADRADVIIPASEIFITIADALGCDRVQVPNICLADCITDGLYRGKTAAAL